MESTNEIMEGELRRIQGKIEEIEAEIKTEETSALPSKDLLAALNNNVTELRSEKNIILERGTRANSNGKCFE